MEITSPQSPFLMLSIDSHWLDKVPTHSQSHSSSHFESSKASYQDLKLALPQSSLRNVPSKPVGDKPVFDTGAQMNITGVKKIEQMGYSRASLFPVSLGVEGASRNKIHII